MKNKEVERIDALRKKNKISVYALAKKSGFSQSQIATWFKGKTTPLHCNFVKLESSLKILIEKI